MLTVARRIIGKTGLAADCVQDAFINAFEKIGGFERRSSLTTLPHRRVVTTGPITFP